MATTTHIKNIIKANKEQSLAIFIGAGISKSSESEEVPLPTWGELISDLKAEIGDEAETDYLKLAQLYYLEFGEHAYYKKLKSYFPNKLNPSSTHRLIFEISPQVIITTNWDCLLEKAIEENGYLYETIASDSDLVKSALKNKLIKMHGDFKSHNIVFKEDDYINYQNNFPLIENYIKSILSTHTVLFVGYSYNDLNLKQISKWIQLQSNVRPPMYLTVYSDNKTQTKYLSNHGIATILLHKEEGKDNSYSERMLRFLEKIKQGFELTSPASDDEICEYFLTKLKTLSRLDAVLIEQVQDAIGNCGFLFVSDARAILELYAEPISRNASILSLEANKKFVDLLRRVDAAETKAPKLLNEILHILAKAQIKGVIIKREGGVAEYFVVPQEVSPATYQKKQNFFNFYYRESNIYRAAIEPMDLAFALYQLNRTEEAFNCLESAITDFTKNRDYTRLFVAMFNRNTVLRILQLDNTFFRTKEEYNLKEKFFKLPKDSQTALQSLFEFIDFSYMYKKAYESTIELKKANKTYEIRNRGGFSYSADEYRYAVYHENLLNFVALNKVAIEGFSEFKEIIRTFVQTRITKQLHDNPVRLTRLEIFSCVKHIDDADLESLLSPFISGEALTRKNLQIEPEDKDWLIGVALTNLATDFIENANCCEDDVEGRIARLLLIAALYRHNTSEIQSLFTQMEKLVAHGNFTLTILKAINRFFQIQGRLYKAEIDKNIIISYIESILTTLNQKLASKTLSFRETKAITNYSSSIYNYAISSEANFSNLNLIRSLIANLSDQKESIKVDLCKQLLFNVRSIASKSIIKIIDKFALKIKISDLTSNEKLEFPLYLHCLDIRETTDKERDELSNFVSDYSTNNIYSSQAEQLFSLIDFLAKSSGDSFYTNLARVLEETNKKKQTAFRTLH